MSEQAFCYWLKGFVELTNNNAIDEVQWKIIKDHLELVFKKVTPNYTLPNNTEIKYESIC